MDLSKLKALELPTEEIEVEILGEKQKVKIAALDDVAAILVTGIAEENICDAEKELKVRRLVLEKCIIPPLSSEEVDLLITKASAVVSEISPVALKLTREFGNARKKTREEAEKNSAAAALTDIPK